MPAHNPFNPDGTKDGARVAQWSQVQAEQVRLTRETLELINAGWSRRAVAERHGCTLKTVTTRYKKALRQYLPAQEVEQARRALMDRLDTLVRSDLEMMAAAKKAGNIDSYVKLHGALMQVEDRRIDIMGLQAPKTLVVQERKVEDTPQETALQDLLAKAREQNEQTLREMTADAPTDAVDAAA